MNSHFLILTAYTPDYEPESRLTTGVMKDYANRHGHRFCEFARSVEGRRGNWAKIDVLCDVLDPTSSFYEKDADFILWLDIDALIVRPDEDIRTAVDPGYELLMTWHDINEEIFHNKAHFNSGVMVIRKSEWSLRFFRAVQELGQLPHKWADQASILHLLGHDDVLGLNLPLPDEPWHQKVGKLSVEWNSIPGVVMAQKPIVHHYAGVPRGYREKLLKLERSLRSEAASENTGGRVTHSAMLSDLRSDYITMASLEQHVLLLQEQLAAAQAVKQSAPSLDLTNQIAEFNAVLTSLADLFASRSERLSSYAGSGNLKPLPELALLEPTGFRSGQ